MNALSQRLPDWAKPLDHERRGLGSLRLAETTILALVGVLLATATVYDLGHQVKTNHRLIADLSTWRAATGHRYHNLAVEQDRKGHTTREIVCGNVSPGGPRERTQICLVVAGRVLDGRREVRGGYYRLPKTEDVRGFRYGCFGEALALSLCGLAAPPSGAPLALAVKLGRP